MSRRDREGFAIIKISFKPEYKFDVDALTSFNKEEAERKLMQSLEDILASATGGKGFDESSIDATKLKDEIRHLASDDRMVNDLSSFAKLSIQQLVQERVSGIYKNDPAGFVTEFENLLKSDQLYSTNMVKDESLLDLDERKHSTKSIVDEIYENRDRFRSDVADQLRRRMIKYNAFTKRQDSDFIKPRVNELEALDAQKTINDAHITQLESESAQMEANQNNQEFDKEAYYKLKQQLKERNQPKERLLSQGLP
jgi:hypothetical protein